MFPLLKKTKRIQSQFLLKSLAIVGIYSIATLSITYVVAQNCTSQNIPWSILAAVSTAAIGAGLILSYVFAKGISKRIEVIKDRLLELSDGQLPEKLKVESEDDLSVSSQAINSLIDRIHAAATFAGKIGDGELNIQYDLNFQNDVLAKSLQSMHGQLKTAAEDNHKRNWVTTGLANFGDILRSSNSNIKELSSSVVSNLVKYLKANQGQLYIVVSDSEENQHLELMGTYAWQKNKILSRTINRGEGLAGQAWEERGTIYLKEIPKNYVRITSGLGEALPNCVLITPLKLNDEVFGIVEIASFEQLEPYQIEFVEKLGELIASTLSTVRINERTRELLTESQHQTEELRAQEEEMRQNMEELTATQEEMARKDVEMSGQLMAIDNSMATIEFTMAGEIVTANEKFLQFAGYRLDEIKGRHHRFFLDPEYAASAEYAQFWQDLNNGIAQTGEFKRVVKGGKKSWISASYTVVRDHQGRALKVIKFALDITDQKIKALDFEGQINAVNKTMAAIEFDLNGKIITANQNFLDTMGYMRDEIVGHHHRMFVDAVISDSPDYKKFWNDLRDGHAQTGEFRRVAKGGKEVWIQASYTPIRDAEGKVYKIVKFAQDITEVKTRSVDFAGQIDAVNNTMASIEFDLGGNITNVNDNFLKAMGYKRGEVIRHHHSMFVSDEAKESAAYKKFWDDLRAGMAQTGEFKRLGKDNKQVWIHASYTPIKDGGGKVYKVIKFAQDITLEKMKSVDFEGQINAVNNTMAAIEFTLDGKIVNANDNFLRAVGYAKNEIIGNHHSMFVSPEIAQSTEYNNFWNNLRLGKAQTGEFKRVGKNGKEIWISASYTPIANPEGKVYKVIKFAHDITMEKLRSVDFEGQINAIRKSTAVIEFDLTGRILYANNLFVEAMGYSNAKDVIGGHHSMFVSDHEIQSGDYSKFWDKLQRGESFAGEFQRKKSNGQGIWIYGSYNPILNAEGQPYKIVKYAQVVNKNGMEVLEGVRLSVR